MRSFWAQRILFLADRDALVEQALTDGFKAHLPNVALGFNDSIGGRVISGVMTVALFYFGVRRLRLLRIE
jgi:hypothetical protein